MVLRGESVGAKRHRAFWESSKWQQASFDYFPSIDEVQTCAPMPVEMQTKRPMAMRTPNTEWDFTQMVQDGVRTFFKWRR
jgi:hypothetical protein